MKTRSQTEGWSRWMPVCTYCRRLHPQLAVNCQQPRPDSTWVFDPLGTPCRPLIDMATYRYRLLLAIFLSS